MAISVRDRFSNAWNAFKDPEDRRYRNPDPFGIMNSRKPDRVRLNVSNERSFVSSLYTQIAIDVASIELIHARLDENGKFVSEIDSELNNCLTLMPNIDQTAFSFKMDVVLSLFDEGVIAIVPTRADYNKKTGTFHDIYELRTGQILEWYPHFVRVRVYNEDTGRKEDLLLRKEEVAIVENPLSWIMNEPNSTLKRLINKLNLLDAIDQQSGSGKLDLIIQLPYTIKTPAKRAEAEKRRKEIEVQLMNSKYGIAYTGAEEHITQLNRAVENNLMEQIQYLTSTVYGQLGMNQTIFDGTADEKTMLNYYSRTVEPVVTAITTAMKISFLSKTARSQGQSVYYLRNPFKLVPVEQIAEIADKFTRNEILSPNEVRSIIGYKPSDDPQSDVLRNRNLNMEKTISREEEPKSEEETN